MSILDAVGSFFKSVPVVGDVIGAVAQNRANQKNEDMQREFATHGIRWRVEDAKAAGLHPLSALGATGASASPSAAPLFDGQNLSRSLSASQTPGERAQGDALHAAQLADLNARTQKTQVETQAIASESARQAQAYEASKAISLSKEHRVWDPSRDVVSRGRPLAGSNLSAVQPGAVKVVPQEITAAASRLAPHVAPAPDRGWVDYDVHPSFKLTAPKNDEGWTEGLESLPFYMIPGWIQTNIERYGADWPLRFIKWSLGADPSMNVMGHWPRKRTARGRSGVALPPVRR